MLSENFSLLSEIPHRRYNPLIRSWILCSPHRAKRPWHGKTEAAQKIGRPEYDPTCYLCPGNTRAGGETNPDYCGIFIFNNDFSALLGETGINDGNIEELLQFRTVRGICRVICFSPRHDLSMAEMAVNDIGGIVETWKKQTAELAEMPFINYVQIFENKGEIMGCSNPHPHGQIWASESIPEEPAKESVSFREYRGRKKSCLLCDYVELELKEQSRIVCENESFVCLVPFWAIWPFETMILPKSHFHNLTAFREEASMDLADIMKKITCRYDNLFKASFPYSMGIHQASTGPGDNMDFHLHLHFYPPLLRSASVKKFMVGYEMLAEPQRDITAEQSAEKLRALSAKHYKQGA